jgi:hypothetical protein
MPLWDESVKQVKKKVSDPELNPGSCAELIEVLVEIAPGFKTWAETYRLL